MKFYEHNGNKYPNGSQNIPTNQMIHPALMGDPALKSEMGLVESPKSLSIVSNSTEVSITWDKSSNASIMYDIYKSENEFGPFKKVNESPIVGNSFVDFVEGYPNGSQTKLFYYVQAMEPKVIASGTFLARSYASKAETIVTSIESITDIESVRVEISPNPVNDYAEISIESPVQSHLKVVLYSLEGQEISVLFDRLIGVGSFDINFSASTNEQKLAPGLYLLKLFYGNIVKTEKLIVMY